MKQYRFSYARTGTFEDNFQERWTGRDGSFHWAARSPDLKPLDFNFRGILKQKAYLRQPTSLSELRNFIIEETSKISPQELSETFGILKTVFVCVYKKIVTILSRTFLKKTLWERHFDIFLIRKFGH